MMARITLILSVITAVIALLGGFRILRNEWQLMKLRKRQTGEWLLTILLLVIPSVSDAADWFVRPNGGTYGSENGTDWSNAYDGFSGISWGSVACGDTIWIAGGNYTQSLTVTKSCTAGNVLSIRRARSDASEATSATGWSSGFDALINHTNSIDMNGSDYITLSGAASASPADFGDYGWKMTLSGSSGNGFDDPGGSNNITVEYMELQGPCTTGCTGDARGLDWTPASTANNLTLNHVAVHHWESGIYLAGSTGGFTCNYCNFYDIAGNASLHPNIFYIGGGIDNGIVKNSWIHDNASSGTGIAFSDGGSGTAWTGWEFYGNVFSNNDSTSGVALNIQEAAAVIKFYNNTFYQNGTNLYQSGGGSCGAGSETKNNLYYGSGGALGCGTSTNNITASSDPFADLGGDDYHIISTVATNMPKDKGTDLGSPYDVDPDGITRGADGTWDVGAYEYDDGEPDTPSIVLFLEWVPLALGILWHARRQLIAASVGVCIGCSTMVAVSSQKTKAISYSATLKTVQFLNERMKLRG